MLILGFFNNLQLWVESEKILHLKVGCLNFGPVRGSAIYPTMGRIEADIALESWLFEFRPCLRFGHISFLT